MAFSVASALAAEATPTRRAEWEISSILPLSQGLRAAAHLPPAGRGNRAAAVGRARPSS